MTREIESQLKQMFADLDEHLPAADFTSRVTSEVLELRWRARLLWASALLAAVAFLWFAFPHLEAGIRIVVAGESLAALAKSPLVYVYGTALGGYGLLWLLRRFQIRLL